MPTTSLGLRYPALSAAPNVPADVGNLAADANTQLLRLQPLFARKTAPESVTSSTTLQNDDNLVLTGAVSTVYELTGMLKYDGATTGDIKLGWSAPAGASLDWVASGLGPAGGLFTDDQMFCGTLSDTPQFGALGATAAGMWIGGLYVMGATAGSLQLRWAQGTSNATATRLLAGSYLCFRRVG